jgi:hypothetical protein
MDSQSPPKHDVDYQEAREECELHPKTGGDKLLCVSTCRFYNTAGGNRRGVMTVAAKWLLYRTCLYANGHKIPVPASWVKTVTTSANTYVTTIARLGRTSASSASRWTTRREIRT